MTPRLHWFWRTVITWMAGVICAVAGFLIYGQILYHAIGLYDREYTFTMTVLLVVAHGFIPILVSTGVYHWLSAPRWQHGVTRCGRCGYILSGLREPRCPECGTPI